MQHYTSYFQSPIGLLEVSADKEGITSVQFVEKESVEESSNELTVNAVTQLTEYFEGTRKEFNLTFSLSGTEFQKKIWTHLENIPFGKTVSYLDIANTMGTPSATRAIGNANSKNGILIFLPCHRVIGHGGKLVGYAGELWRKKWLLDHELKLSGGEEQLAFSF